MIFPKKEQPHYTVHDLQISDAFMQKVVGELDPNGSGDMVARFVKINNEMRKSNNKTLSDLRFKTADNFLFSQPFARQSHSQAEATFADLRNYIYQGKKIDQQVHLGYDLAVTQHVGVEASNDGRIVWAAPLGIYGNCIVVDHGYGLQTIYGHMSHIDVHEGDMVKRGQIMGQSGMTGMAGGDHIHFAMQLDGVQIDPKEWWDRTGSKTTSQAHRRRHGTCVGGGLCSRRRRGLTRQNPGSAGNDFCGLMILLCLCVGQIRRLVDRYSGISLWNAMLSRYEVEAVLCFRLFHCRIIRNRILPDCPAG